MWTLGCTRVNTIYVVCVSVCLFTVYIHTHIYVESESDMWPSMVTHTQNLCSAFIPSKVHTHSSKHTHTVNTHPEQWAAIYAAAPGEQLGVRCLAQGHLSRGIEGGESAGHSLPPPTIPASPRLELTTWYVWPWTTKPVISTGIFVAIIAQVYLYQ